MKSNKLVCFAEFLKLTLWWFKSTNKSSISAISQSFLAFDIVFWVDIGKSGTARYNLSISIAFLYMEICS